MSHPVADIFQQAAGLNREDPRREGNVVALEAGCEVIVCGDLHGNRTGLAKVIAHADVAHNPTRRLVLQEITHGPVDPRTGHDRSVEVLLRAARLKVQQPDQVIMLLSNHDLAQATGNEITKGGRRVCEDFVEGLRQAFEDAAEEILPAVNDLLLSQPLGIRCANRTWIGHTLPSPRRQALVGTDVLGRPYTEDDLHRGGGAYEWTWGRNHTPEQIDALAAELDVDFFVLAHQRIETGYEWLSPRAIVLASDDAHGYLLRFATDAPLTDELVQAGLRPIAALG